MSVNSQFKQWNSRILHFATSSQAIPPPCVLNRRKVSEDISTRVTACEDSGGGIVQSISIII